MAAAGPHGEGDLEQERRAGKAFHTNGKPLYDEFCAGLVAAGFPCERYLEDTLRLAELLESG